MFCNLLHMVFNSYTYYINNFFFEVDCVSLGSAWVSSTFRFRFFVSIATNNSSKNPTRERAAEFYASMLLLKLVNDSLEFPPRLFARIG